MAKVKLSTIQASFVYDIARLIMYAWARGYRVTLGRGLETPAGNRANGGKEKSLHLVGLAQDLNLFLKGAYLRETAQYKILGDFWKSLNPLNAWGGDFSRNGKATADGGHFSRSYDGMK